MTLSQSIHSLPRPLLVGVSGGVDSVCLLRLLHSVDPEGLIVCHMNHGIRGEEAKYDEQFVKSIAEELGLPYEKRVVSIPDLLEEVQGASFEALARQERLTFFSELAVKHGTRALAVAHHQDDQAETIVMQLARGTKELVGIGKRVELAHYGLTVYRPFLTFRKKELISWMLNHSYKWCEDKTNAEPVAVRNRVRNELLPLFNDIFQKDVVGNVTRFSYQNLRSQLPEMLEQLNVLDPQGRLFLPRMQEFSRALQLTVVHTYLRGHGVEDVTEAKVLECCELISSSSGAKVNLPGGAFFRRKEKRLFLWNLEK